MKFILCLLVVCMQVFCLLSADMQRTSPEEGYQKKDYTYLLGMEGFSDELLKMHFQLYQGYVKNTNLLLAMLKERERDAYNFGAIKRRIAWELDGMRLHELYFENLGGSGSLKPSSPLYQKLVENFGSFKEWKREFIETGMLRGIGWVILYQDPQTGELFNLWINEHDVGHLAGGMPLLVMDVFEHAYMPQYGLDREGYITAFFNNINWPVVSKRLTSSSNNVGQRRGERRSRLG
jgi:Fe-Mn family superoxide dismutase